MRRRELIALAGSAAVASWRSTQAQQPTIPVIGYVGGTNQAGIDERVVAFRDGLAEMGFADGQNVLIEFRWTEGHIEHLPKLMVDLVRRPVAVIFTVGGDVATLIAKGATRSIPIVFLTASDPVKSGLVVSLNRPGFNATGVTMLAGPQGAKRLQILRELVPQARAVGLLVNPTNTNTESEAADVQASARTMGLEVSIVEANSSQQVEKAFASVSEQKFAALVVNADPLFFVVRDQILSLAARAALPTIYYAREFPVNGGLISYGTSIAMAMRQCGSYVGRILKGANPTDLPVAQPTKFELVINLKTANSLGLMVPATLLATANEVIE